MYWGGKVFLSLMGAFWVFAGVIGIVVPKQAKILIDRVSRVHPYKLGWIPLILGILIYLTAFLSSLVWMLKIIGILGILKGLFLLFMPQNTIQVALNWRNQLSEGFYRLYGILVVTVGICVIVSLF